MPLVRVDLVEGKPETYRNAISNVLSQAMTDIFNIPEKNRFIIMSERSLEDMMLSPDYLNIQRSANCVVIQITLNNGYSVEQKKAFYHAVAYGLQEKTGMRLEDVFINLVEVQKENWSFGMGEMQYTK